MRAMTRFVRPLASLLGSLILLAAFHATPAAAATGATLSQPTVTCAATRATVNFAWRPVPGSSEQWIDLTTLDNNFAAGTYISAGPFNGSITTYSWEGIAGGTKHFWRVTSLSSDGWVASEAGNLTPCASTASGISYVFGTNVSASEQKSIKDGIQFATDFGQSLFGYTAPTFSVSAYQDVGELAEALARWFEDPSPNTIQRFRTAYGNSRTAGVTGLGDGIFIPTWTDSWQKSSTTSRFYLLGHEYFHVVQGSLDQGWTHAVPESLRNVGHLGTPTWLTEGSAEYFGLLIGAKKADQDYANIRAQYVRLVASNNESLIALETSGKFSAKADEAYPLGALAVEYLTKDKGGISAVVDYYRRLGNKEPWQAAFNTAFGMSYSAFIGAFDQYRAAGFK